MKLDNFKNSPMSIISYIIFTGLLSYLIIGHIWIAVVTTILNVWIFLMPRLQYENFFYKKRIPKFLEKTDIINKMLNFLFPTVLWLLYAFHMKSETFFNNPWLGLSLILAPIIPAGIQYLILKNAKRPANWIAPFVMAILTFIGVEFVAGNIKPLLHTLFPFLFNETIAVSSLWVILLEILFIYAIYKIISFILPFRTVTAFLTATLFVVIATFKSLFISTVGMEIPLFDMFNIKPFIEAVKFLFTKFGFPTLLMIKALSVIILITVIVGIINKWSTIYDFKERAKGSLIGIIILCICFSGFIGIEKYADNNNLSLYNGSVSVIVSEIKQKVDTEINNLGWEQETTTPQTETQSTTKSSDTFPVVPEFK